MQAKWVICLLSLLALSPVAAIAQIGTATVLGNVGDSSGAAISGASVVIENSATGIRREFTTGDSGSFEFPYLSAGTYQVTVKKAGFQTKVVNNYSVEVEQRARLDVTLIPGQVIQKVQVTGTAPLINTDSATVGQVIENRDVVTMPLNGRNWISLAFLAPGVIQGTGTNADLFSQGGSVSVSGGRVQNNNYTIDGTDNNDLLIGGFALNLSVEAIQEFKVQNDLYTAEYGRTGGGQVNLVTKSGSNEFHGDAFNFIRNSSVDANSFFSVTSPPLRRNQFGGTLGGPIKKDRAFFFLDYEGLRLAQGLTQTTTTPTTAQRQGIFGSTTVVDPNTGTPFPNNTIPAARISPVATQVLSLYYPQPKIAGATTNNYTSNFNSTENDDQFTARVDVKLTDKDTIAGRVSHANVDRYTPDVFAEFGSGTDLTPTNVTFDNVYIISPRQINEFRVGMNRPLLESRFNQVFGMDLITPLGIQDIVPVATPQYIGLPYIAIGGYASVGVPYYAPIADFSTFVDFLDDHTYIKGKHSIKAGLEIKNSHQYNQTGEGINGELSFSPTFTSNAMGDFLLGLPTLTEIGAGATGTTREYLQSIGQYYYVMDDWKATNRLMLNLGLRYEYNPPWVEKQNRLADVFQAANLTLTPVIAGVNGISRSIVTPDKHDIAPRFGFSYQPLAGKKIVIRGGYGIFYNQAITNVQFLMRSNPPFFATKELVSSVGSQLMTLQNPFPPGVGSQSGFSGYVDPNIRDAYIGQWSLNVENEIPWDIAIEIGYVGSKGTKMPVAQVENQPSLGPGSTQSRSPNPTYGLLTGQVSFGGSSYNALQAKLEKRMSHGVSLLLGYTLGKSLDTESSTQSSTPQNSYNLAAEWGRSDYDRKQSFVGSYVWNLPFGAGQRWARSPRVVNRLLSGWFATGIVAAQTGLPLSVTLSGNISSSGVGADRPNRIGNGSVPSSQRTLNHWLDSSAFTLPPAYTFGNSGRNILTGPGFVNWDQSLMKDIPLFRERQMLQLRFEAFNSVNHPQFANPAGAWNLATFGTISSTTGNPRNLQLGAKYVF